MPYAEAASMSTSLRSLPNMKRAFSQSPEIPISFASWSMVNQVMHKQYDYWSEAVAGAETMLNINSLHYFRFQNPNDEGEMADIWLQKPRKALKQLQKS